MVRAQSQRLLPLLLAGGKGGYLAAPGIEELQGQMPQSPDADDGDLVGGLNVELNQWIEDGNARAEEWASGGQVDAFGNRHDAVGRGPHLVGKAAVMSDDGRLRGGAQVLVPGVAEGAGVAVARVPAQTHGLSDGELLDLRAEAGNRAHHFVPGHDRVLGHAPFVVDHTKIAMAEPRVEHIDLDFVAAQFARVILEWFQFALCLGGCICLDHA